MSQNNNVSSWSASIRTNLHQYEQTRLWAEQSQQRWWASITIDLHTNLHNCTPGRSQVAWKSLASHCSCAKWYCWKDVDDSCFFLQTILSHFLQATQENIGLHHCGEDMGSFRMIDSTPMAPQGPCLCAALRGCCHQQSLEMLGPRRGWASVVWESSYGAHVL